MEIEIVNSCADFKSYRAERVKSLFNASDGSTFRHSAKMDIEDAEWKIGVIVGQSGSGKTSLGKKVFGGADLIRNLDEGWNPEKPIVDCIAPEGDFNEVTASLASVGLGDVPTWLRPYHVLSNGQKFRAGLAKLICDAPDKVVVDEFTSVVDRQIAQIGALAFQKAWRRLKGKQVVLLSCHYDILDWVQPDWVYDTTEARFERDCPRQRPRIELQVWKVDASYWKYFKPHYYLDLVNPPAAEWFIGTVNGELACHVAVCPFFTANAYRATRLVVMPEWQGAGVGTKFLEWVCEYHKDGYGRCNRRLGTLFHTSHPQLCAFLRRSANWIQKSAQLYGGDKVKSRKSIAKATIKRGAKGLGTSSGGYGGHFRAVQGFKYVGDRDIS